MEEQAFKRLYPFTSNWLSIDNRRYHYLDEGPRDGPVVVMLHGNPTWSFYYRTLVSALRGKYRLIVPDHMGCGLSEKPQDYAYTIRQHIQNLQHLLTQLEIETSCFFLHDWGGAIGMGYAVQNPARVNRFVIFNTAAFSMPSIPWRIRVCRSNILGGFLVRRLNAFARLAMVFGTSRRSHIPSPVKKGYLLPYDNWRNRIALHRFVQEIPLEEHHPNQHLLAEIEQGLVRFRHHPMLIIWGGEDFCFTERHVLPQWRSRFPEARVRVFKNAGHLVVEDAHEQIVPLLMDFLP